MRGGGAMEMKMRAMGGMGKKKRGRAEIGRHGEKQRHQEREGSFELQHEIMNHE